MDVFQTMPLWDHSLAQVQWGAAVGASLAGAAFDLWTRRMPNRLTGSVLASGLVWALWVGGRGGLAESVLGCALLGSPFVVLWAYGGGGAGDAKLMGAVGSWLGLANGVVALLAVVVWGAVLGMMLALFRGRLGRVVGNLCDLLFFWALMVWHGATFSGRPRPSAMEGVPMPYGISILCGVLTAAAGVLLWRNYL